MSLQANLKIEVTQQDFQRRRVSHSYSANESMRNEVSSQSGTYRVRGYIEVGSDGAQPFL